MQRPRQRRLGQLFRLDRLIDERKQYARVHQLRSDLPDSGSTRVICHLSLSSTVYIIRTYVYIPRNKITISFTSFNYATFRIQIDVSPYYDKDRVNKIDQAVDLKLISNRRNVSVKYTN